MLLRASLALFLGLPIVLTPVAAGDNSNDQSTLPRFERAEIPDEIAPSTGTVEFGYLFVPENRNDPSNTSVIRLPVMIAKSRSSSPQPDPIVFTVGGPGVLSTMRGGRDLDQLKYLDDRDFIYLEQRGAQYAKPSLIGPEIDSAVAATLTTPNAPARIEAAKKLKERLVAEGIDPTAYTTRDIAADIEDLRQALGIDSLNLYGVSYSCKIMLEVIRRYPAHIRAAILDSPLPPDVGWDETSVQRYWNNLEKMFNVCGEDSLVNARYPDLEKRFRQLLTESDKRPIDVVASHPTTGEPIRLSWDAEDIFRMACHYMENSQYIYGFAHSMNMACNRDSTLLSYLASEMLVPYPYAWGMRYSVWCSEEIPFEDLDSVGLHESVPDEMKNVVMTVVPVEIFDFWPRRELDPLDNSPVTSQIPVLVANGEFDPDTPPEWGKQVCKTLTNSYYFEFEGQGHLPLFTHPCGPSLGVAFLNNPTALPDSSCLAEVPPFRFFVE